MPEKLIQYFEGHLSELANKYYVPSEEFAASEYLKYQDVLVVCIPEVTKQTIKALVVETAELKRQDSVQYESIEYLRSTNQELQGQIKELRSNFGSLKSELAVSKKEQEDLIAGLLDAFKEIKNMK